MPDTEAPITSPPAVDGNNYDATAAGPAGPWAKLGGGNLGPDWKTSTAFPSTPPWEQT
jgi:hypothetical protein